MKKPVILLLIVAFSLLSVSYFRAGENHWYISNEFLKELWVKLKTYTKETNPERIYIFTDKALYGPGETIWFSTLIRNADDLKASRKSEIAYAELYTPQGKLHKKLDLIARDGIAVGDFHLHTNMPGGVYKIKVYTNWMRNSGDSAVAEKQVQLQNVIMPNLLMKLDFPEKGYSAGALAEADFELNTLDNRPLIDYAVTYIVQLNGQEFCRDSITTDWSGKAKIRFNLPENLSSADGILNVVVPYRGSSESITRAIPIVLSKVKLAFYPEGGDMVAGLPCNMAFEAQDYKGKAVKAKGAILNSKGEEITKFNVFHHGRGSFEFIPKQGEEYFARIDEPKVEDTIYALPASVDNGIVLQVSSFNKDAIQAEIWAKQPTTVSILLSMRGKPLFAAEKSLVKGRNYFTVPVTEAGAGVAALTVFDANEIPLAERMVFLNRHKRMKVKITAEKEDYGPREKVQLHVQTLDENDNPVSANVALGVADEKVHTLADDKSGHILSKMLLEADIKGEIEEPNFYFDEEKPNSIKALDYVMLTRGWRKFEWKKVHKMHLQEPRYRPELASISGKLIYLPNKKPAANAVLRFRGTGQYFKADEKGNFNITGVDLYKTDQLIITTKKQTYYLNINSYFQDAAIALRGQSAFIHSISDTGGAIAGIVRDENGDPLPGATVTAIVNGLNRSTMTNEFGQYRLNMPPGSHSLTYKFIGYNTIRAENIWVEDSRITFEDVKFGEAGGMVIADEVVVVSYKKRLIEPDNNTTGAVITRSEIRNLPMRTVHSIAATAGSIYTRPSDPVNIRGSRSDVTRYYVDGVLVRGAVGIPQSAIQEMQIITGGVSAEFEGLSSGNRNDLTVINSSRRSYHNYRVYEVKKPVPYYYAQQRYYKARIFPKPAFTYNSKSTSPDYSTTIYWNGNIATGADGKATVEFYTNDGLSAFKATAEGISTAGLAGRGEFKFFTTEALMVEAKVPPVLTQGDKLLLPLSISNNRAFDMKGRLNIALPPGLKLAAAVDSLQTFRANSSTIVVLKLEAKTPNTIGKLQIFASTDKYTASLDKPVKVVSRGFPVQMSFSGQSVNEAFEFDLFNPIEGTVTAGFTAYPDILHELMSGVEGIIREPYGCFEQVSSATYPNILALQYMRETGSYNKEIEQKALAMIEKGYNMLCKYETVQNGFEWYGNTPPHEALSAYGLMEFLDMQKVYNKVSQPMIDRTRVWLYSRRDGNGGFKKSTKSRGGFSRSAEEIYNAYIIYALSEAGEKNLTKEYELAYKTAHASEDPYQWALMANAAHNFGKAEEASSLILKLLNAQERNGSWTGTSSSITSSYGTGFTVETTSLALLAVMREGEKHYLQILKGVEFLTTQRKGHGTFGSTQATILALKALTKFAGESRQITAAGAVTVYVNNKAVVTQRYEQGNKGKIVIPLQPYLSKGKNVIAVKYSNKEAALPYSINVDWTTALPRVNKKQPIEVQTSFASSTVKTGENLRLKVLIENTQSTTAANPIAIVGIPAGASLQPWQLRQLQHQNVFDFYEIRENDVVFYYREIEASGTREILLDLKTEFPGTFNAVASSAYPYYANEYKSWSGLGELTILP